MEAHESAVRVTPTSSPNVTLTTCSPKVYSNRMNASVRAVEIPDIRLKFIDMWSPRGGFHTGTVQRLRNGGFSLDTCYSNAAMMEASIKKAELFWVAPTFLPLLLNAANSLPLDAKFSELPVLPPDGLLVFDAPDEWSFDGEGIQPPDVAAISWHTGGAKRLDGSMVDTAVFADAYARYESVWVDLRSVSWGGDDVIAVNPAHASPSAPIDETSNSRIQRDRRILGAFAHLITQETITDASPERMPRPVQKRSERKNVPSTVRVVRLRHLVESEKNGSATVGSGVEYSHQWLVSGHWRNQPCGTGLQERKLIWVNPHVKGPSDKPLVLKETVKALVR